MNVSDPFVAAGDALSIFGLVIIAILGFGPDLVDKAFNGRGAWFGALVVALVAVFAGFFVATVGG